jgi:hypothetical protein
VKDGEFAGALAGDCTFVVSRPFANDKRRAKG